MNSVRRILIGLTLTVASLALGQSPNAARVEGNIESGIYRSETLGLTYSLPDGYFLVEEHRKLNLPSSEILFIADQHIGRAIRNRILITADGADNYHLSLKHYTSKFVTALSSQGRELLRPSSEVRYANKLFYRADLKESSPEATAYQSVLVTERRGYWVIWSFISGSKVDLETMVASLDRLRFQDNAEDLGRPPRRTIPVEPGKRVRVPESISSGMLTERPTIELPVGYSGPNKVVLKVLVNTGGYVRDISVISGPPQLTRAAMMAADRYRYQPLIVKDHLVEMETLITVVFTRSSK